MIYFYLKLIFLFSLVRKIFMENSPFDLLLNYDEKQIINSNFTITAQLQYDTLVPIECEHLRHRFCLVELSLQIKFDNISMQFWCQSPAVSFSHGKRSHKFHSCILPAVNATEQPSVTMIINSDDVGKLTALATAKFMYSSHYFIEKRTETPISILVKT